MQWLLISKAIKIVLGYFKCYVPSIFNHKWVHINYVLFKKVLGSIFNIQSMKKLSNVINEIMVNGYLFNGDLKIAV